ncbi:hypothetical protein VDG1235_2359 [Verrucomicrobiia bacterium DG1235]|nr:hypothetical protein VDG1235_2359 [Verrucomicrobiae bacterium DG1235]
MGFAGVLYPIFAGAAPLSAIRLEFGVCGEGGFSAEIRAGFSVHRID